MNDPETNDQENLITRALRGQLSQEEQRRFQQRLTADPALQREFEEEKALDSLLEKTPKLPVPTNFTSLVLQAMRKDQGKREKITAAAWFRFRFARVAVGLAVVVAAGFFGLLQYREAEREQTGNSVRALIEVATVIGGEEAAPTAVLQDFEAIQRLSIPQETELDLELLFALQKE